MLQGEYTIMIGNDIAETGEYRNGYRMTRDVRIRTDDVRFVLHVEIKNKHVKINIDIVF